MAPAPQNSNIFCPRSGLSSQFFGGLGMFFTRPDLRFRTLVKPTLEASGRDDESAVSRVENSTDEAKSIDHPGWCVAVETTGRVHNVVTILVVHAPSIGTVACWQQCLWENALHKAVGRALWKRIKVAAGINERDLDGCSVVDERAREPM